MKGKKPKEYSQRIVAAILIWAMVLVSYSYVLAWFEKSINESVTITLIGQCVVTCLGYFIYQAKLKDSRNKHGLDKDGKPYNIDKEGKEDETL